MVRKSNRGHRIEIAKTVARSANRDGRLMLATSNRRDGLIDVRRTNELESGTHIEDLVVIEKILTDLDKKDPDPSVERARLPPCWAPPQGSLFD